MATDKFFTEALIEYRNTAQGLNPGMLKGFFEGWKNYPSDDKLFELIDNSDYKLIAVDSEKSIAVGFITAVSDNVLSAYIPLLEVIPGYRGKGIGSELVKRMLEMLKDFYMIDVACDKELQPFYERFGMKKYSSMILRNYSKQSGSSE